MLLFIILFIMVLTIVLIIACVAKSGRLYKFYDEDSYNDKNFKNTDEAIDELYRMDELEDEMLRKQESSDEQI